jgi:hypothetical protein
VISIDHQIRFAAVLEDSSEGPACDCGEDANCVVVEV